MRDIPPLWLTARPAAGGLTCFALPPGIRLALAAGGGAYAVEIEAPAGAVPRAVQVEVRAATGAVLERTRIEVPAGAVHLPRGAALLAVEADLPLRVGLYPNSKVSLKLHAFVNGRFPGLGPLRRWKEAGAAARDLRAVHGSLFAQSADSRRMQARRYQAYRARFVEDFTTVRPPDSGFKLSFLSDLAAFSPEAAHAACVALDRQTDAFWEWVVAVPEGIAPALAEIAQSSLAPHPRVRLCTAPEGGAAALNAALAHADGALVSILPGHGTPTRDAVAMIRDTFAADPHCRLLYTDEERTGAGGAAEAGIFKPAYNRHLLRTFDYFGDLLVLRTEDLRALTGLDADSGSAARHDLALRATEGLCAGGIRHLPRVAFTAAHEPPLADDHSTLAVAALRRLVGVPVDVEADGRLRALYGVPDPAPLVSLVIPTRDRADLMGIALRSLIEKTRYRNFEIVIVDNGSVQPETFALFDEIAHRWPATRVVRDDGAFNYPRICNAGVDAASGSLICLLNNDIEVTEGGWLDEMVGLAGLPGTGVVGAKLLFPNRTIQHAGVIVGLFRYAAHWFSHAAEDAPGPLARLVSRGNVSAVTGACLLISRTCWDEIGPLDAERFAEDCNDIDLCLRARRAGYEVVWTPYALLLHHESASRGRRRSKAHRERLKAQRARMEALWHTPSMVDPHYNPNLSRSSLHALVAEQPEGPRTARSDRP